MGFYDVKDGNVRIFVRLTPKAAKTAITGQQADGNGQPRLKVSVTAVPEKGKANKAVVAFLAKRWRLPKSAFKLVSGQTDRNKLFHIAGEPSEITEKIEQEGK